MSATTRRNFLKQSAIVAAGALLLPRFMRASGSEPSVKFPTAPRDRVAVAAYPFREFTVGWKEGNGKGPTVPLAQQVELKDFAAHVAEKFNVHKVELWSPTFPSTDPKYLDQMRASVAKASFRGRRHRG